MWLWAFGGPNNSASFNLTAAPGGILDWFPWGCGTQRIEAAFGLSQCPKLRALSFSFQIPVFFGPHPFHGWSGFSPSLKERGTSLSPKVLLLLPHWMDLRKIVPPNPCRVPWLTDHAGFPALRSHCYYLATTNILISAILNYFTHLIKAVTLGSFLALVF